MHFNFPIFNHFFEWWVYVRVVFVRGGICPAGICPGGICPGGICPAGICPDTKFIYLEFRYIYNLDYVLMYMFMSGMYFVWYA